MTANRFTDGAQPCNRKTEPQRQVRGLGPVPSASGSNQRCTVGHGHLGSFRIPDLIALLAIAALIGSLGIPALGRVRGLSRRDACAANLKSIGLASKIYANDNNEYWMIPAYRQLEIDGQTIDYLNNGDGVEECFPETTEPGQVGYDRDQQSESVTARDLDGGSTTVSTTRAYWMLVRSGEIPVQGFICPSSGDREAGSENAELFYDFSCYTNVSYGYQVPFGPRDARLTDSLDPRLVVAADKGPYYLDTFEPTFLTPNGDMLTLDHPHGRWRPYNSPNHRRTGQNCLFLGGNVSFERDPAVGIDADNIYTLMVDQWDGTGFNRIHGDSPHFSDPLFPFPGQDALGAGLGHHASTDSLIYP